MAKITIEAVVAANPQKVWERWTAPQHITQWNTPSEDWHCPRATNDLRVGGTFVSRMEAKDGSFGFDFGGVYDEVEELKKIRYTLGDGRQALTVFEDLGGKTKVTTTFDPETMNPEEMQKQGWQAILNNFKKHAEAE